MLYLFLTKAQSIFPTKLHKKINRTHVRFPSRPSTSTLLTITLQGEINIARFPSNTNTST